jgi:hypothetical protein
MVVAIEALFRTDSVGRLPEPVGEWAAAQDMAGIEDFVQVAGFDYY